MISVHFQGKTLTITVIKAYAPTSNAEEAEVEQFYDDLQDLLELTHTKKDVLFIIGNWNAKVGSQEIPGVTGKFGLGVQNEAGKKLTVLPRECTGHSKYPLPTTQRQLYTWTSLDGQYRNQIDYILCSQRWRSSLYSQQKEDWELTVAQIMNSLLPNSSLKNVGNTTRPFSRPLNQIPYDYAVEVTNRFSLID